MKTMTYSESRAHYAETLDAVIDDREEVVITRAGHDPVVIVALDDHQSLEEAAYLLRSPENARRLLLQDVARNGNAGIGKPESSSHHGYWSRRITDEHRLVFKVVDDEVRVAACRYHHGE